MLRPGHKRKRGGASLPCPKCGRPSHVRFTRRQEITCGAFSYGFVVIRERECLTEECRTRFVTNEESVK